MLTPLIFLLLATIGMALPANVSPVSEGPLKAVSGRGTENDRTVTTCNQAKEPLNLLLKAPAYDNAGTVCKKVQNLKYYGFQSPKTYTDFAFKDSTAKITGAVYATEHILELQMMSQFFNYANEPKPTGVGPVKDLSWNAATRNCPATATTSLCGVLAEMWFTDNGRGLMDENQAFQLTGASYTDKMLPADHLMAVWPGNTNAYCGELALLQSGANLQKMLMFKKSTTNTYINDATALEKLLASEPQGLMDTLKNTLGALYYLKDTTTTATLKKQKERVQSQLKLIETYMSTTWKPKSALAPAGEVWCTWVDLGLDTLWATFAKDMASSAKTRAEKQLEDYVAKITAKYASDKTHGANVKALETAYEAYKKAAWNGTPF